MESVSYTHLDVYKRQVENPLLVSVRSGAKISMPGMMDTILNLGLNDQTVEGLAALTENPRFAYDSYRRFIQMFGDVVMEDVYKRQPLVCAVYPSVTALIAENCLADWIEIWKS